jgi:hypothetical protein
VPGYLPCVLSSKDGLSIVGGLFDRSLSEDEVDLFVLPLIISTLPTIICYLDAFFVLRNHRQDQARARDRV